MKFSPWIDPRVEQVHVPAARSYLLSHGWKLKASPRPQVLLFEGPLDDDGEPIVLLLPATERTAKERGSDYYQRIIELITSLASIEDRYAVDVLNDILRQPADGQPIVNGPGRARTTKRSKSARSE
jgi:hypothetical protein